MESTTVTAEMEHARNQGTLDRKFKAMVREVIWHVAMVAVMGFVIVGNQNSDVFWQNKYMRDTFLADFPEVRLISEWLNVFNTKH